MEELIFDRTQEDVDYAILNPNSQEYLKGTYNYTDLNRIDRHCYDIKNKVADLGYSLNIEIPRINAYYMEKNIFLDDINRIRKNVQLIQDLPICTIADKIECTDTINFEQANTLEKILYNVESAIKTLTEGFSFCGTFYCGDSHVAY